jgi:hypothetical protein
MLQDIAMPQQQPVEQLRLAMDYRVSYSIDKVNPRTYELRIRPDTILCQPVGYFGFDVASYVTPTLADLTFLIVNQYGFVEDSLVFLGVKLDGDHELYYSRSFSSELTSPSIRFSSVKPFFDEASYAGFRQDISMIDYYYAATELLESALKWTDQMFPSGKETFWNYYLQYFEISRLLRFTDDSGFRLALRGLPDPAGYREMAKQMNRKKIRVLTILLRMASENPGDVLGKSIVRDARAYASWVISYGAMASIANHRFSDFYSGLVSLDLNAGLAAHQYTLLQGLTFCLSEKVGFMPVLRIGGMAAVSVFSEEAVAMKEAGDYVMALKWYQDAHAVGNAIPGSANDSILHAGMSSLKIEMADSYLSLARMAATRSTTTVTEGYLQKAREIYSELYAETSSQYKPLLEVEHEIYSTYCHSAEELISGGKYMQALDYLTFLMEKCSECRFDCAGDINRLNMEAKTGLYGQLIDLAVKKYETGDIRESGESLRMAVELRTTVGSRITRDPREAELSSKMDQDVYKDYISEGTRYLNYQQYDVALYYLSRARSMEASGSPDADPRLEELLKEAAKPVIEGKIEEGRALAIGYFFSEGWEMMLSSKIIMQEYGLDGDEYLNRQINDLEERLRTYQCEKLRKDYVALLLDARFKKENGDYIGAMDQVTRCIGILIDDTLCAIDDQEAWYLKAQLEYPAEYTKRKQAAMALIPADPDGFVTAYDNLYRYYQSMKLSDYGVVFVPFHTQVMLQTNVKFLDGILGYYIRTRQKEQSLDVLHQLWTTGHHTPTAGKQKDLADWLARDDLSSGAEDPIACLNKYVPADNVYRSFRVQYKYAWLRESGWKIQYFSLFLKNKSVED